MKKALKAEKSLLGQFVEEVADEYIRIVTSSHLVQERLADVWEKLVNESSLEPDELIRRLAEKLIKRVSEDPRVPEEVKFMIPDMVYSGLQIGFEAAKTQQKYR